MSGQEMQWQVDGLTLRGLAWGPEDGHPVLALHGWLDNALSFEMLAGHLPQCRIVALDLTGHGRSAWRSADATYQIWDDVPQIAGVLAELGWERFTMMGHSRGAVVATLTAAALADRVHGLILLDWMLPPPMADAQVVPQFRKFLADRTKRTPRTFGSAEAYIERRVQNGNTRAVAETIARRGLGRADGARRLLGDPRLYGASALKLSIGQIEAFLDALSMPAIWFSCRKGQGKQAWADDLQSRARARLARFEVVELDGHHHAHMETETAARIAMHLADFWRGSTD